MVIEFCVQRYNIFLVYANFEKEYMYIYQKMVQKELKESKIQINLIFFHISLFIPNISNLVLLERFFLILQAKTIIFIQIFAYLKILL